jgi:hypothetical protein
MSYIKIKQLNERVATAGLFMGEAEAPKFRRKLEPGEIVEIPDDMTVKIITDDVNLLDMLHETGHIDIVPSSFTPTRPLDYDNRREAKVCSPTFKPRDPTDARDMDRARAKYAARLNELYSSPQSENPDQDSPDDDDSHSKQKPPVTRRGMRRARAEAAKHGEAHTT